VSATGRGGARIEQDNYGTPAWCVHRLLERCELPGGRWLESCGGDGAIMRAVSAARTDVTWDAIDIRPECEPLLRRYTPAVGIGDFLKDFEFTRSRYDVLLSNPPYALAPEFVDAGLRVARFVALLLRVNFLGTEGRAKFFHERMPQVFILPNRPTFVVRMSLDSKGRLRRTTTDATEYAWMVWESGVTRRTAPSEVLDLTPPGVLRAARAAAPVVWDAAAAAARAARAA
jgi:hypothetical protein